MPEISNVEPRNENQEVRIKSGGTYETINLLAIPDESSVLVQRLKQELIGNLNTSALFKNLEICGDLFEVVYDAVNGIQNLQSGVWKLRQDMISLSSDSANKYVNRFINNIDNVPMMFNLFLEAFYSTPIQYEFIGQSLGMIENEVADITKGVKELVISFQELTKRASDMVIEMSNVKNMDNDKKKELTRNILSMQSKVNAYNEIKASLDEEIEELKEQYEKINLRIDKASDQQFWLGITSAVTSAIGTGLSVYASNTSAGIAGKAAQNIGGTSPAQDSQMPMAQNIQSALNSSKQEVTKCTERIKEIKTKMDEKTEAIKIETDAKKKEDLIAEKQKLVDLDKIENENLIKYKVSEEVYTNQIAGLGAGLSNLSEKLDHTNDNISKTVTSLVESADKIVEIKSKLNHEKREIMKEVADYTLQIEQSVVTNNSLDLAILALCAGIGSMKIICMTLQDFQTFWTTIESECSKIETRRLGIVISSAKMKMDNRYSDYSKNILAVYSGQWVALKLVLQEYREAFNNIYRRLQNQLKLEEYPNPEMMWKRAIKKSKGMSDLLNAQALGHFYENV